MEKKNQQLKSGGDYIGENITPEQTLQAVANLNPPLGCLRDIDPLALAHRVWLGILTEHSVGGKK